jgi:2-(1,2-epoxy-1,2-dihydrophenyl)acetyl-CoA isomerase
VRGTTYDSPVTDEHQVLLARSGAVATVTLNRPHALNSFTVETIQLLLDRLREVGADPEVRAVVLTGSGRGFSAGASLEGGIPVNERGVPDLRGRLLDFFNPVIAEIRAMPKPVIAAVNGVAAGFGMSFALACDLVYAAESASFAYAFSGVGLSGDGGFIPLCAARIGLTRTAQIALTGERVSAKQALEWGLVNEVHPDLEVLSAAQASAATLAAGPAVAHAGAKEQLTWVIGDFAERLRREADVQQRNGETQDFAEGVLAFQEKRPPQFLGR